MSMIQHGVEVSAPERASIGNWRCAPTAKLRVTGLTLASFPSFARSTPPTGVPHVRETDCTSDFRPRPESWHIMCAIAGESPAPLRGESGLSSLLSSSGQWLPYDLRRLRGRRAPRPRAPAPRAPSLPGVRERGLMTQRADHCRFDERRSHQADERLRAGNSAHARPAL